MRINVFAVDVYNFLLVIDKFITDNKRKIYENKINSNPDTSLWNISIIS